MTWRGRAGTRVRWSTGNFEFADDLRKAPGPGGVVGKPAGGLPEVHRNRGGVPAGNAETASHNRIGRQEHIGSLLKLQNPASPAGHCFEGCSDERSK